MIQQLASLNWISVLLAFIAYFVLGGMWFAFLFKKQYLISLGKQNEPPQKMTPIFIAGPALCTLVVTIAAALLMQALGITTYAAAIEFAFVIGIGFLVSNTVNIAINPNMPHPIHYGIISGAYHLVGITIACLILVAMK